MLDIRPRRNDRAEDHETKGEEGHICDGAAEPEDFAIGDQNDCQVLENGVDGDGKEFEGLRAGVNHADEEEGDREPYRLWLA
jgi:hypothetical protein